MAGPIVVYKLLIHCSSNTTYHLRTLRAPTPSAQQHHVITSANQAARPAAHSLTQQKALVLGLDALLAFKRVRSNLLVVALQSRQILAGLGELALLHALADVPVHEGALGVHQVELVGQRGPGLGDGGGVGKHAPG